MPENFGARLRQRRETQAVSLQTIADQTKIKLSLLEALERDDVSRWPSGIFRRAYIRAYAHAIGLDPDVVVREFLEVHPEKGEVVETLSAVASAAPARPPAGAATRLRQAIGSAIGSLSRGKPGAIVDRAAGGGPTQVESARRVEAPRPADARAPITRDEVPARASEPKALEPEEAPSCAADDFALPDDFLQLDITRSSDRLALADEPIPPGAAGSEPDLGALSRLCTEIGRARQTGDVQRQLPEAARILDALGLIVWAWDMLSGALRPALVHGYSQRVLAQLPPVKRDADNATATAFRYGRTCAVNGEAGTSAALAVPLLTPHGCGGVLAIELQAGREQIASVRAAAEILAALLAQLVVGGVPVEEPQAGSGLPQQLPLTSLLS